MKSKVKNGLVIVNTGNGKGKSTSAFSMLLRSRGRGFRVCVVQFIKAETGQRGEFKHPFTTQGIRAQPGIEF
jgi:cob(I)alamin adenosyltransferase